MARVIVVTCAHEGGYYSPYKDERAPIRIYSDRWVEDDIAARHTGLKKRQRLTRKQFRAVKAAAVRNRANGVA